MATLKLCKVVVDGDSAVGEKVLETVGLIAPVAQGLREEASAPTMGKGASSLEGVRFISVAPRSARKR